MTSSNNAKTHFNPGDYVTWTTNEWSESRECMVSRINRGIVLFLWKYANSEIHYSIITYSTVNPNHHCASILNFSEHNNCDRNLTKDKEKIGWHYNIYSILKYYWFNNIINQYYPDGPWWRRWGQTSKTMIEDEFKKYYYSHIVDNWSGFQLYTPAKIFKSKKSYEDEAKEWTYISFNTATTGKFTSGKREIPYQIPKPPEAVPKPPEIVPKLPEHPIIWHVSHGMRNKYNDSCYLADPEYVESMDLFEKNNTVLTLSENGENRKFVADENHALTSIYQNEFIDKNGTKYYVPTIKKLQKYIPPPKPAPKPAPKPQVKKTFNEMYPKWYSENKDPFYVSANISSDRHHVGDIYIVANKRNSKCIPKIYNISEIIKGGRPSIENNSYYYLMVVGVYEQKNTNTTFPIFAALNSIEFNVSDGDVKFNKINISKKAYRNYSYVNSKTNEKADLMNTFIGKPTCWQMSRPLNIADIVSEYSKKKTYRFLSPVCNDIHHDDNWIKKSAIIERCDSEHKKLSEICYAKRMKYDFYSGKEVMKYCMNPRWASHKTCMDCDNSQIIPNNGCSVSSCLGPKCLESQKIYCEKIGVSEVLENTTKTKYLFTTTETK
jgi:hypothetical protein